MLGCDVATRMFRDGTFGFYAASMFSRDTPEIYTFFLISLVSWFKCLVIEVLVT
jgi:hypothetical protein